MRKTMAAVLIVGLLAGFSTGQTMAPVSVTGNATFQQEGDNWTVTTTSDRTVINWSEFGVAEGATVHFQQPAVTSAVLNRVLGSQASYINGLLSSNGGVYLLNPNGVVVGPGGTVQVARFIASTLSIPDAEFLSGRDMNFKGASQASIENHGRIEAIGGDVYLIARNVVNTGAIRAEGGSANLVAGLDVLLTQDGDLFVRPCPAQGTGIGVDNRGVIEAILARLQADGNMYALAINNTGSVRATGHEIAAGRVLLRADGGAVNQAGALAARTVRADGATVGGEVQVLGKQVAVTGKATIDASGDLAGGRVLIGGDRQGANPDVPNAQNTSVGPDARLAADALLAGEGGSVIVWSDDATTVAGAISAQGAGGAAGGFVETSGHTLDLEGLELSCGAGGTWLVDAPADINDATLINDALDAGTNYWYWSTTHINVNDTIEQTIVPAVAPLLWLDAWAGKITINQPIDVGTGTLRLTATDGVNQVPGTTVMATNLQLGGIGAFHLEQPGNDFGTIGVAVFGNTSGVWVQDVNDLRIGAVGNARGVSVTGGEVHITTPNGCILVNGLLGPNIARGYHAIGNVAITERSFLSESYEIRISNKPPESRTPTDVENFLGIPGELMAFNPNTDLGSAVIIDFLNLAGDSLGYDWNFRVAETLSADSANDYSFALIKPVPFWPRC